MTKTGVRWGIGVGVLAVLGFGLSAFSLYTQGVKEDDEPWIPEGVSFVIVSTEDIPAGTDLSPLLDGRGPFMEIQVPDEELAEGAISRVEQLEGATTALVIRAGEQIVPSQLSVGDSRGT